MKNLLKQEGKNVRVKNKREDFKGKRQELKIATNATLLSWQKKFKIIVQSHFS